MQLYFQQFAETHFPFFHPCPSGRAGGTAFLVSREFCSNGFVPSCSSLVAGRANLLRLTNQDHELMVINLHNFVTTAELPVLIRLIRGLVSEAKENPIKKSLFLVGDINISALPVRHVAEFANSTDVTIRAGDDRPTPSSAPGAWKPLLDELIEIFQDKPTRFGSATGSISILDRCFTTIQPWILPLLQPQARPVWDAAWSSRVGLGDHAPVAFIFQPKSLRQPAGSPIPIYISKSEVFGKKVDELIKSSLVFDDPNASLSYRLDTMKQIFNLASKNALDELGHRTIRSLAEQLMLWTSMVRAFWYKRAAVAEKCLSSVFELIFFFY